MPAPSLVSRASARITLSSPRSEISTGQLSAVAMINHLLPAGAAKPPCPLALGRRMGTEVPTVTASSAAIVCVCMARLARSRAWVSAWRAFCVITW
jgi:hypothetical protein